MYYHLAISVFVMFFLGQVIHAWLRAQSVIQSKLNGISGYGRYLEVNGAQVMSRFFLAYCCFGLWVWHGPELMALVLKFVPGSPNVPAIPVNVATAGIFGYFADSLIDVLVGLGSKRWPWLQKEVPPEPGAAK